MDTPEEKIHHYQQILKSEPENREAYLQLGIAFDSKAGKDNAPAFLTLAIDRFRHAIKLDPGDESAHDLLISSAAKKGILHELVTEYREKSSRDPDNLIFKNCIKKISVLSSFSMITPVKLVSYKPSQMFKLFFDYIILPSTVITCCFSIMVPRELSVGFLKVALMMFVSYIFYKWLTFQ